MIYKNLWRSITTIGGMKHTISIKKLFFEYQYVEHKTYSDSMRKRLFDILLAGTGLLFSSWLCAIVAIAIIIDDGFPVLIRQPRVGRGGNQFFSFKFRSMSKYSLKEKINSQALESDPRITTVGKFLRKVALDELPQLLNIFLGQMSFVGPRPLLSKETEINGDYQYIDIDDVPGYKTRSTICPGLTGIAQIYAPRDIPRKYKFKYDILYIRKMNLQTDIKLIILSFLISCNGAWEKRHEKIGILKRNAHRA
jgi:lipopolysaccharide/colanic/teichoic acid biosynthesis glycosyltransferase